MSQTDYGIETIYRNRVSGTGNTGMQPLSEWQTGDVSDLCEISLYASWQGDITWLEGEQTESFESLLQMLQMIDRIFTGQSEERGTRVTKICQIAINSCEKDW